MAKKKNDDEGKAKKKRGPNWTSREDKLLTQAWSKATLNSIKGNYQKEEAYWSDVQGHFVALTKPLSLPERSVDSMQARWRGINAACSKFNGIFVQVTRMPKSGWNDEKYMEESLKIYQAEEKENFSYYDCWMLLKDHAKWSVGETSIRNIISGNKSEDAAAAEEAVIVDDGDKDNKKVAALKTQSSGRPQGQKIAKEERKQELSKTTVESMNATSLRIRAAAQQDTVTYNVMKQLGSDNPVAKEWFEMMAARAVQQMRAELEEEKKRDAAKKNKEKVEEAARLKLESASNNSKKTDADNPVIVDLNVASSVSPAASSITAPSSSSNNSLSSSKAVNECCAGDYCIISNGHLKVCGALCFYCQRYCHFDCAEQDEDGMKKCNCCDKNIKCNN
jgi:hypothetical protein